MAMSYNDEYYGMNGYFLSCNYISRCKVTKKNGYIHIYIDFLCGKIDFSYHFRVAIPSLSRRYPVGVLLLE